MSLLSEPDLLIHSLRLGYLRNVEDPYGPRLISFNPSFSTNPYVTAASLADATKWPELITPPSPPLSPDYSEGPAPRPRSVSGFPGATGLKYSHTILGPSRTGALGMSVSGRRRGASKLSRAQRSSGDRGAGDDASTTATTVGTTPTSPPRQEQQPQQHASAAATDAPPPLKPAFVPKFKGAAEMDERRRLRLLARRGAVAAAGAAAPPEIRVVTSQDNGEEEEEEDPFSPVGDEDFDVVGVGVSVDIDGDEFDPEFATTRLGGMNSDSVVSDSLSGVSASLSTSNSFNVSSPLPLHVRSRARLSPVTEDRIAMVTPLHPRTSEHAHAPAGASPSVVAPLKPSKYRRASHGTSTAAGTASAGGGGGGMAAAPHASPAEEDLFARQKVPPVRAAARSALSSMMAASNTTNPFSDLYSSISGRGVSPAASMIVTVFYPFAREPAGEPMKLSVRKDATVEEVLGFALWSYWEAGWLSRLDEDPDAPEERLSAVGWVLKIAEDDGEVDEDFPPPNRETKISKFNFDAYAVLEANPTQVQQNKVLEGQIQRSPSRVAKTKRADTSNSSLAPPAAVPQSTSSSSLLPSTLSNGISPGSYSSSGPQIFLRIRIQDTVDAAHLYTTISVSATMYMQEALEMVCRRRKLHAKEYALLLSDMSILIPLDRTVASLQGESDLRLVKRSMLPHLNVDVKPIGRSSDPNASIFKRVSDVPDLDYDTSQDFTAAYKKYTVYRKMPMIVGKHERTLAIDGPYIHIMPANKAAKAVFDNGKTSSYHINSVVSCQSAKSSSSAFRIVVHRDGGNKRYEFEAENAKLANEIVQTVKGLKSVLERTGSVTGKSRRGKPMA
ncbi:stress-activated map kinase interacting protein 1-domain-containing protein [Russula earlei]|uniref:Stress-activated map kinase interacting protein 1-domain-containing protein n=1 Tax=Russula earlei TaxID=71964 RepID=A0ACC0UGF4_9AGAM|nr:stress-activated map kinase interacting protein 1-domain-containing protein [Russula earlei]